MGQYIYKCLLFHIIFAIKSKLYIYLRYRKSVKFTNKLTKHVNAYKILNFLPYY